MEKTPPDPPPDPDLINQPSLLHIRNDEDNTPPVIVLPVTGEIFFLANPARYTKWTLGGLSRFPLGT